MTPRQLTPEQYHVMRQEMNRVESLADWWANRHHWQATPGQLHAAAADLVNGLEEAVQAMREAIGPEGGKVVNACDDVGKYHS